jgi:hypothetical protein
VDFPIIKALSNGTVLHVLEFDQESHGRWALVDLEGDGVKDGFGSRGSLNRLQREPCGVAPYDFPRRKRDRAQTHYHAA